MDAGAGRDGWYRLGVCGVRREQGDPHESPCIHTIGGIPLVAARISNCVLRAWRFLCLRWYPDCRRMRLEALEIRRGSSARGSSSRAHSSRNGTTLAQVTGSRTLPARTQVITSPTGTLSSLTFLVAGLGDLRCCKSAIEANLRLVARGPRSAPVLSQARGPARRRAAAEDDPGEEPIGDEMERIRLDLTPLARRARGARAAGAGDPGEVLVGAARRRRHGGREAGGALPRSVGQRAGSVVQRRALGGSPEVPGEGLRAAHGGPPRADREYGPVTSFPQDLGDCGRLAAC